MSDEKRKYRRLALTVEDGYFGTFHLAGEKTLVVPILSISAGGIKFAMPDAKQNMIEAGDKIRLKQISGMVHLSFLSDLNLEVRWKETAEMPGYVDVGCEIFDLSDSLKQQVTKFVDGERKSRGQYN